MKAEEVFRCLDTLRKCAPHHYPSYNACEGMGFVFQHDGDEDRPHLLSNICVNHRFGYLDEIDLVIPRIGEVPLTIWAGEYGDGSFASCQLDRKQWGFVQRVATMMKMATNGDQRPTPEQLAAIFSL